jgi:hypothetical protein
VRAIEPAQCIADWTSLPGCRRHVLKFRPKGMPRVVNLGGEQLRLRLDLIPLHSARGSDRREMGYS